MAGATGFHTVSTLDLSHVVTVLGLCWIWVWFLPNTQEILATFDPALKYRVSRPRAAVPTWLRWRPNLAWAVGFAVAFIYAVFQMSHVSEFIYWQF